MKKFKNILLVLFFFAFLSGCLYSEKQLSDSNFSYPLPDYTKLVYHEIGFEGWEERSELLLVKDPETQKYTLWITNKGLELATAFYLFSLGENFYGAEEANKSYGYVYTLLEFTDDGIYGWSSSQIGVIRKEPDFLEEIGATCKTTTFTTTECEINSYEALLKIKNFLVERKVPPDNFYSIQLPAE